VVHHSSEGCAATSKTPNKVQRCRSSAHPVRIIRISRLSQLASMLRLDLEGGQGAKEIPTVWWKRSTNHPALHHTQPTWNSRTEGWQSCAPTRQRTSAPSLLSILPRSGLDRGTLIGTTRGRREDSRRPGALFVRRRRMVLLDCVVQARRMRDDDARYLRAIK
jgi:hypothetical protein